MKLQHTRSNKSITVHNPLLFFAQEREVAAEAFAGDIIGIPNHGNLRIGDTLTEGEDIIFRGVPSFAPEILRRVKLGDAMKAKKETEDQAVAAAMQWLVANPSAGVSLMPASLRSAIPAELPGWWAWPWF
jgi:peptide chain release factor 3